MAESVDSALEAHPRRLLPDRPISSLIKDAGFHIAEVQTGYMPGPKPMTFMYEGSARLA
jgi:hypothetical protein